MSLMADTTLALAWGGLTGFTAAATGAAWVFHGLRPSAETRKTTLRIRTWWVILLCLFAAMAAGPMGIAALFLAVSLLALREFVFLDRGVPRSRWLFVLLALATVVHYASWVWPPRGISRAALVGGELLAVAAFACLLLREARPALHMAAAFALGVAGLGMVLAIALIPPAGLRLVFMLLLLTGLNDVAQYLWGKGLGGPRVAPGVSPNKTWAGLLGGVATTGLVSAWVTPLLTQLDRPRALVGGLLLGLGGFLGDLLVSAYKRRVDAGESGTLLPGHGGMLDRIDSLCITAPLFYVMLRVVS